MSSKWLASVSVYNLKYISLIHLEELEFNTTLHFINEAIVPVMHLSKVTQLVNGKTKIP